LAQLRHIAAESVTLEIYGLSTRVDVEPLIKTIQNAPSSRRRLVRQLLPPYVAALQGRLRELRDLHTLIDAFVGHLSKYLAPKNVSFSVQDGLVLLSPTGDRLSPGMLSSGERHLLLIMCTACVATTSHTLCIIDEPEISLNIMWQRTLLRTLLDIAAESNLQFIVASHSIPLITQHREHVVELLQMGERTHE
jgi:predicted ATPase